MKRKIILLMFAVALSIMILPACKTEISASGSVKSLSMPYIAQYECAEARYGEKNLLDDYDYIRIILINRNEIAAVYKLKDGEKKTTTGTYTLDTETRELEAEFGILGFRFKEKVIVDRGGFTISKIIGKKELFMKFMIV